MNAPDPAQPTAGRAPHGASEVISAGDLDHHGAIEDETGAGVVIGTSGKRDDTEMDMTPMVDVTFLLLIFFMVTAAFTTQKSLPLPTPKPDEPSTNAVPQEDKDPSELTVIVNSLNTYQVISSEFEAEAPSEHEMRLKVREAMAGAAKPKKMLIKAHVDAAHERVVAAMDAATASGLSIQYMTIEEDE